ncbi:hypothetical protein APA_766 [Pseudanabaena sp. lw0831]|uniref:HXXEE domain-containing protein n=1 Tax=Pseudanabaena sp. lw0831 TaxID=1357935 RepID=UPI0019167D9C|nr:HXXEE domain-containing protein [Pseudanabaena sp. lw0831]GBO52965.1 hypothetical protein APA_766 [Pseudanabaena sp. lw0831]
MLNAQHFNFDISILLLAIAIIIHTISEAWIPEYQKAKSDWRSVVFNPVLFWDNLPIFIASIVAALADWKWAIVGGILPAVGVTHPLLDHLGLSWKNQKLRPGSLTGLLLLFPLSIWSYALIYNEHILALHELLISSEIGLAISLWLLWMVVKTPQEDC